MCTFSAFSGITTREVVTTEEQGTQTLLPVIGSPALRPYQLGRRAPTSKSRSQVFESGSLACGQVARHTHLPQILSNIDLFIETYFMAAGRSGTSKRRGVYIQLGKFCLQRAEVVLLSLLAVNLGNPRAVHLE